MGILSGIGKGAARVGSKARAANLARVRALAEKEMKKAGTKTKKVKVTKEEKAAAIAKRKAIQKRKDEKTARELARVDPGVPAGAQTPLKPVGTPKTGLTEKITAGTVREGSKPKIKDPVKGKKAKGGTKKARRLIAKVDRKSKKKLQRDWEDLTVSQQRAQIAKGKDSKYWTIFPKEGGGARVTKGHSGAGRLSKKGKAMEPGTFALGGLAKKGHKDFRKGGIFY
tara:strand:+ start:604 stop:1281 length:678 start_codon:yes stop_codon:yes gene_type:complete